MNAVNVKRPELLDIIRKNRDSHRTEFERATDGWKRKVTDALDLAVEEAKAGKNYRTSFNLPQPRDYTSSYDEVIGMLEMSVDDTVELTQREYQQYINDDWGWKHEFTTTNSSYVG